MIIKHVRRRIWQPTAEKVLFHLFHYGESHASAIADDFKTALNPVIRQLNRFEASGILVSKEMGRSRVYSFNPKSPFRRPILDLLDLLEIAYESIPLVERQKVFGFVILGGLYSIVAEMADRACIGPHGHGHLGKIEAYKSEILPHREGQEEHAGLRRLYAAIGPLSKRHRELGFTPFLWQLTR